MRTSFLPFHVPLVGEQEIASVVETLRSGWLTTGPKVHCFEQQFARAVGAPAAVAVSSATAALHLALEAIGLTPDDEVLVPTMTFAATAEVVTYFGATPILVDCDPVTLNIDPSALPKKTTARTKAIIPVHFAGHPCDMDCIMAFARTKGLAVIEDAAHALPASYRGRPIGSIGDVTCFSFYATKTITTGEGGMIATGHGEYAERMRLMSLHGISKDAWKRYAADGSWRYDIVDAGYKYNMSDIAAALGIAQLARMEEFRTARARIAAEYDDAFADLPEVCTPVVRGDIRHAWHLYAIQIDPKRLTLTRDEMMALLKAANIGASVHFIPLHLHSYYRRRFRYAPSDFPVATAASDRIVSLPLYPAMNNQDVTDVIDAVRDIIIRHRR